MFQNPIKIVADETIDDDDSDDEDKRTIFCANLCDEVTEDLLYELFLQAGPIEEVRIPKEPDGKRQKSFGFITYVHKCTVPYAIKLYEGVKLFKRTLTIKARTGNNNNKRNTINSNFNTPKSNQIFNQSRDELLNVNRLNMEFLENLIKNPYGGGLPIDINSFNNNNSTFNHLLRPSTSSSSEDKLSRHSSSRFDRHHDKPYKRSDNYNSRNNNNNNKDRHYNNRQDRSSNQRKRRL